MANWKDSRFGQFADPNFGTSLYGGSDAGVLPAPSTADTSASSASSNKVTSVLPNSPVFGDGSAPVSGGSSGSSKSDSGWGGMDWSQLGPGLLPHSGGGSVFLAEGGAIDASDTGNDASDTGGNIFDVIGQAITYGRKKFSLPTSIFKSDKTDKTGKLDYSGLDNTSPSSSGDAVSKAVDDEGGSQAPQDDLRAFNLNNSLKGMSSDEGIQWGDTYVPGQKKDEDTAYLADGGEIEDDTGVGDDQSGVIPMPSEGGDEGGDEGGATTTTSQSSSRSRSNPMAYLAGSDAVGPEVASALERSVDPAGRLDPMVRKMAAVQRAGSPDKAWGLMQHYRQKYNNYSTFARAALQGGRGRPPSLAASTQAATQAFDNVLDGKKVTFKPAQGGVQVQVRDLYNRQQPKKFAEGGSVDDESYADDMNYETAGAQPWAGSSYDVAAQQAAVDNGENQFPQFPGGKAPHEYVRDFFLDIPSYLGLLSGQGGGQDAVYDKGVEATLEEIAADDAAAGAPSQDEGQGQPFAPPARTAEPTPRTERNYNEAALAATSPAIGSLTGVRGRAPSAQQIGSEIGAKAANDPNFTIKDVLHEIDQAYGMWAGTNQERSLARAAAIQTYLKNKAAVDAAHLKGEDAIQRARIAAGSRENVANINQSGRMNMAQFVQDQVNNRAVQSIAARMKIAQQNNDQRSMNAQLGVLRTVLGAQMGNMQGTEDANQAAMAVAAKFGLRFDQSTLAPPQGGPSQPPRQPVQQAPQQQSQMQGEGPAPSRPAPEGYKYQVNRAGTKWRLVPAQ